MSMAMYMQKCADEAMASDRQMARQCVEFEHYSALKADRELAASLSLSGFAQFDLVESDDDVVVTPTPVVRPAARRKRAAKLANAGVGETCNICLEDMGVADKRAVLKCKHVFHQKCLAKWMKRSKTCPVDRLPCGKVTVIKAE